MARLTFRRAHLVGLARDLASQQLAAAAYAAGRGSRAVPTDLRTDLPPGCDGGAAFVAHCLHAAGFTLAPWHVPSGPDPGATVPAWVTWATASDGACYYPVSADGFVPDVGDLIVVADRREPGPPDQIGVIIDQTAYAFITAEGNVKDRTGIVVRRKGHPIQGFILLLEGDETPAAVLAARVQQQQARAATDGGSGWRRGVPISGARVGIKRT